MSGDTKYFVRLRIGHKSEMLDRPTSNGLTHRWTVFVHSCSAVPFTDRSYISKVVFELHPDFPNPRRVVKEPPFEVTEMGYAGFSIPIHITFTGASKVYKLTYDMNLVLEKYNEQFVTQTIEIKHPSSSFRELIIKYGGAKKDPDKRKEKNHRLRKGAVNSSDEPVPKKEREPLSKLKIPRSLVERDKRHKDKSTPSDNLANFASKAVTSPESAKIVTLNSETKTAVSTEVKQTESINSEPLVSAESTCLNSEISKISTLSTKNNSSALTNVETDNLPEKRDNFEFLVRLQKKLMTLEDPDKMLAVVEALLMPSSSSDLPSDLSLTDNNLLSFDVCKLNSTLIDKLSGICFGNT